MSITVRYVDVPHAFPNDVILELYHNPFAEGSMTRSIMEEAELNPELLPLPKEVFALARRGAHTWELSRFHFCAVTSDWVKETYPEAMYEMCIVIKDIAKPDVPHVLILYFK